jgi:two-component system OmpR family response regulator
MLPGMSGFEVCRILHKETMTPILMLTARDDEIDKVTGLDLGADDYMTKPFKMRELLARIRALIRRSGRPGVATDRPLRSGDLEVDTARHCATVEGRTIELTPKEFELLAFLVKNPGILFTRQQLLEMVWGYDFAGDTRTVDVHMRWLREKIEADPSNPKRILTIRGSGYKLEG